VAEQFGARYKFPTPVVESTGSGGGLKLFCGGVGEQHPDIANASRRIKRSEVDSCAANGVDEITEVRVGFDGIVLANSKDAPRISVTIPQIWQALAKEVPIEGEIKANPHRRWSDIDPSLPDQEIEVLGPPPTSGTRDAFVELVMETGCEEFDAVAALDEDRKKAVCATMREDGAFVEAGENDNLIVQKLEANPDAYGIFGFSFLDQNLDRMQGSLIDGEEPTFENIADGAYPVSRSLYFYVKNAHVGVVPGVKEFVDEFTSEAAAGEDGYLADKGLIPLPEEDREAQREQALAFTPLTM
jgi:phosphate transport system substrate-binding protein